VIFVNIVYASVV